MNLKKINQIIKDTDYIHTSGTKEELKAAEYLLGCCQELGGGGQEGFPDCL